MKARIVCNFFEINLRIQPMTYSIHAQSSQSFRARSFYPSTPSGPINRQVNNVFSNYHNTIQSHNTHVSFYAQKMEPEKDFETVKNIPSNIKPNRRTYVHQMQACQKGRNPTKAFKVFNDMIRAGFKPNTCSYNYLMKACLKKRDCVGVFKLFDNMVRHGIRVTPNSVTYGHMINACLTHGDPANACNIVEGIAQFGFKPNKPTYYRLIKACVQAGDLLKAAQLSKEVKRNQTICKCLIDGYVKTKNVIGAFGVFDDMIQNGLKPRIDIYKSLDKVYDPHGGKLDYILNKNYPISTPYYIRHKKQVSSSFSPRLYAYNRKIIFYSRQSNANKAREVFESIPNDLNPNVHTYAHLMHAYTKSEQPFRAFNVFDDMIRANIQPNAYIYNCLIGACIKGRNPAKAFETFKEMSQAGIRPNTYTYNHLIEACAQLGNPRKATQLSKKIKPTQTTYDHLVQAYIKGGDPLGALEIFNTMVQKGFNPIDKTLDKIYDLAQKKLASLSEKKFSSRSLLYLENKREIHALKKMLNVKSGLSQVTTFDETQPQRGSLAFLH